MRSNVRAILLDDENKTEKQTQTLDSVTQRLSQTETSLEDITSQVSMLKEDLSMIRQILRDDEDKIENHAQTLNSVTQEISQVVTYLDEDLFPKVSGKFQNDDISIKSHAQTLSSVTERLSECESSIQTDAIKRSFRKTFARNRGIQCIQQQKL